MPDRGFLEESLAKIIADNDGVAVSDVNKEYVQKSLEEAAKQIRETAAKEGKHVMTQAEIRESADKLSKVLLPSF